MGKLAESTDSMHSGGVLEKTSTTITTHRMASSLGPTICSARLVDEVSALRVTRTKIQKRIHPKNYYYGTRRMNEPATNSANISGTGNRILIKHRKLSTSS